MLLIVQSAIVPHLERNVWLEGETVHLQATVTGYNTNLQEHPPHWVWLKDDVILSNSSRIILATHHLNENTMILELELENATLSDSGTYSCEFSSSLNVHRETFGVIAVLGVEINNLGYPANDSYFAGLDHLDMVCQVSLSHSPPSSTLIGIEAVWSKDGSVLTSSGGHISVSETVRVDASLPIYQSNVSFTPLMERDGGIYVCSVIFHPAIGQDFLVNHTRAVVVDSE